MLFSLLRSVELDCAFVNRELAGKRWRRHVIANRWSRFRHSFKILLRVSGRRAARRGLDDAV